MTGKKLSVPVTSSSCSTTKLQLGRKKFSKNQICSSCSQTLAVTKSMQGEDLDDEIITLQSIYPEELSVSSDSGTTFLEVRLDMIFIH